MNQGEKQHTTHKRAQVTTSSLALGVFDWSLGGRTCRDYVTQGGGEENNGKKRSRRLNTGKAQGEINVSKKENGERRNERKQTRLRFGQNK